MSQFFFWGGGGRETRTPSADVPIFTPHHWHDFGNHAKALHLSLWRTLSSYLPVDSSSYLLVAQGTITLLCWESKLKGIKFKMSEFRKYPPLIMRYTYSTYVTHVM